MSEGFGGPKLTSGEDSVVTSRVFFAGGTLEIRCVWLELCELWAIISLGTGVFYGYFCVINRWSCNNDALLADEQIC